MKQTIDENNQQDSEFMPHSELRFVSSFLRAYTSKENISGLSSNRTQSLLQQTFEDLNAEEISDVKEFQSGTAEIKRFENADDLLNELND